MVVTLNRFGLEMFMSYRSLLHIARRIGRRRGADEWPRISDYREVGFRTRP